MIVRLVEIVCCSLFAAARFAARSLNNALSKPRRPWQQLLGLSLVDLCESLGATFIKIGQLLSTRRDLLPPEILAPLVRLQDQVAPFDSSLVPQIISTELGRPMQEIFAEFEMQPISSASIANVYRARLYNGRRVAVKIRRPKITQSVHQDLRILHGIARILVCLPPLRYVPLPDVIQELGQCIEQQLDFQREATNNRRFRENFAQEVRVRIPRLVDEYCTPAILTMEFIPDLVKLDTLHPAQGDYQESLMTGLRALYQMIFADGFIHCDMHPGNLYFCPDGSVVLLDLGFVARLSDQDRHDFATFFAGIITKASQVCARIIHDTASYRSVYFDRVRFDQAVADLIEKSHGSKAADFQVAAFAAQVFDIQRRYGLRGSTDFTMAIISLLVFEGIAKYVNPDLDFQSAARPFVIHTIVQPLPQN